MAIDTIVFDLGGVVCRYQPELRLLELALLYGRTPEDIRQILYGSGFISETELGLWDAEQIVSEVGARLGRPVGRSELETAWMASFQVDEEVLRLADHAASQHRTAIFTNNDLLLREALPGACPELAGRFDDIVFSAEIHAVKPTAEAFHRAFSAMRTKAPQVLFIDDSAANVAGALHAGTIATCFQNARQLAAELEKHGLLNS